MKTPIEQVILRYLNKRLGGIVYMEQPDDKPKRYVIISKSGGGEENLVGGSMITAKCYEESKEKAAYLNEDLKEAMEDMPNNLDRICSVSLNTDYDNSDTRIKEYMYQSLFSVNHY